jgi:hypothetical protein
MTSISRFLAGQSRYFKECLDARTAFEKSLIWGDSEEGLDYNIDACMSAQSAGMQAFRLGMSSDDVPVLLKTNEYLTRWWTDGWDNAEESLIMESCPGCNDGTGNPCHDHG